MHGCEPLLIHRHASGRLQFAAGLFHLHQRGGDANLLQMLW